LRYTLGQFYGYVQCCLAREAEQARAAWRRDLLTARATFPERAATLDAALKALDRP
jgi:hypothetical protein